MKYFFLDLIAESPLAIRADQAPGGTTTAPYIAGSTLAGSLAAAHRLFDAEQSREFEQLFLSGHVQYPHLYPASFKQAEAQQARLLPIYPLPRTARSCKRFPGFVDDEEDNKPHGVRDSLFDWAAFKLGGETRAALEPLIKQKECHCGKAMHHFSNFYRRFEDKQGKTRMCTPGVEKRLQTHTGINRNTGTVQEGILYSREVFDEQTRFSGLVKFSDELARSFTGFIEHIGASGLVRVGTGRTRGLGKVQINGELLSDEAFGMAAFERRVDAFDQTLRAYVQRVLPHAELQPGFDPFYFTITLHSPALLRDPLLRALGGISGKTLSGLLEMPEEDTLSLNKSAEPSTDNPDQSRNFTLLYQNTDRRRINGWNELWGTPRESEYALETGSVFLFALKTQAGEDQARQEGRKRELLKKLWELEKEGLGQRRVEGFGRICISDPFHLEVTSHE